MVIDITKIARIFSGGTVSCALAHNLSDPLNAFNPEVLAEAWKTGAVIAGFAMLRMAGGITINKTEES